MKEFNFTTAFAMKCDAEQFESVKNEFEAMGYNVIESGEGSYLCTNYANYNFQVGISGIGTYQRLPIETFNRDLCLALAAMTDKPDGIVGEWWTFIGESCENFTNGKVYKQCKESVGEFCAILDNKGDENGKLGINTIHFRKATADELIKYFTEEKKRYDGIIYNTKDATMMQTETERLQKQIAELIERVSKLEDQNNTIGEILEKTTSIIEHMVKPEPKQELQDKQEVWAWDDDWIAIKIQAFYDAKNKSVFSMYGKRNYYRYDNCEPIPADQIPQWMEEAKLKLED